VVRYHRVLTEGFQLSFEFDEHHAVLAAIPADPSAMVGRQAVEFGTSALVRMCRDLTAQKLRPLWVQFVLPLPRAKARYAAALKAPVYLRLAMATGSPVGARGTVPGTAGRPPMATRLLYPPPRRSNRLSCWSAPASSAAARIGQCSSISATARWHVSNGCTSASAGDRLLRRRSPHHRPIVPSIAATLASSSNGCARC
jgi:hypothetical protein